MAKVQGDLILGEQRHGKKAKAFKTDWSVQYSNTPDIDGFFYIYKGEQGTDHGPEYGIY